MFRGEALTEVMRRHRISSTDLNSALRQRAIWSIEEIEVVAIEPTGAYTVYKRCDFPDNKAIDVLLDIPGYKALREDVEQSGQNGQSKNKIADEEA